MTLSYEKRVGVAGSHKKNLSWMWPLIIFSDAVFLAVLTFVLVVRRQPRLESLVRWIDVHFTWIAVGIGIFIALALVLFLARSRQPSEELLQLTREMGLRLERKWGFPGGFGALSLGYGPYCRAVHKGLVLSFSPVLDEDSRDPGLRVTANHMRPLSLGLVLKSEEGVSMEGRLPQGYKSILPIKVDIPLEEIKAWAARPQKAAELLSNEDVREKLDSLRRTLSPTDDKSNAHSRIGPCGFRIDDRRVTLLLSAKNCLTVDLVDAICELSLAITSFDTLPVLPMTRSGDLAYKALLSGLIVLIAVSLAWLLSHGIGH